MNNFVSVVVVTGAGKITTEWLRALAGNLEGQFSSFEIIVVENTLSEAVQSTLESAVTEVANLHALFLTWVCSDEVAFLAGMQRAIGDIIYLSTDPSLDVSLVVPLSTRFQNGFDALYAQVSNRTPYSTQLQSRSAKERISRWLTGLDINAPKLKIVSRSASEYIMNVRLPVCSYIPLPTGFRQHILTLENCIPPRSGLAVMQSLGKTFSILISRTSLPIRVSGCLCLTAAGFSVLYSLYVVAIYLVKKEVAPGWTTLSLQLSFMFFLISTALFMIGEYVLSAQRSLNNQYTAYQVSREVSSSSISHKEKLNLILSSSTDVGFAAKQHS